MRLTGRTRLRSIDRHLKGVPGGAAVVIGVTDVTHHAAALREAGFDDQLTVGDSLLPRAIGPVSRFNAAGGEVVHRDQPKETAYRQMLWTWVEWHGRYNRVERSRIVDVPYERYPRTPIAPPSVELIVASDWGGEVVVITEPLAYVEANKEALLHRVNLLREIFGEAEILTEDLARFHGLKVRRLNWEVLPKGEMPWPRLRERVAPLLRTLGERSAPAVEERLKILTEDHEPDFGAAGRAGFQGYLIFGFKSKRLYVLESMEYGNATYILGEDWETLSQMTKAELLSEDLHEDRLVHREEWAAKLRRILDSK